MNGLVIRQVKKLMIIGVVMLLLLTVFPAAGYLIYLNSPRLTIIEFEVEKFDYV